MYGPVTIGFAPMPIDYNRTDYNVLEIQPGHFVPVIGWDDNYSAENFNGRGAVLINPPKQMGHG